MASFARLSHLIGEITTILDDPPRKSVETDDDDEDTEGEQDADDDIFEPDPNTTRQ